MAEPADAVAESPLDSAAKRLDMAVGVLEGRVRDLASKAEGSSGGLFDQDRSQLAADLDAARARERELKEAGAEASQALSRAIADIRMALSGDLAGELPVAEEG